MFLHFEQSFYLMKQLHVFHHLNLFNQNLSIEIFHTVKLIYNLRGIHQLLHLFYSFNIVKTVKIILICFVMSKENLL